MTCLECGDARTCDDCRHDDEVMRAEAAYERARARGEICLGCDGTKAPTEERCAFCVAATKEA